MPPTGDDSTIREQLLDGARAHIRSHGTVDLSTRSLAAAGGRSTMCLYTKFSGRQGLLEETYRREGERLEAALRAAPDPGRAYWEFGITEPGLYAFLFGADPITIGIDPSERSALVTAISQALDPAGPAGRRWAYLHGMVCFAHAGGQADFDEFDTSH